MQQMIASQYEASKLGLSSKTAAKGGAGLGFASLLSNTVA